MKEGFIAGWLVIELHENENVTDLLLDMSDHNSARASGLHRSKHPERRDVVLHQAANWKSISDTGSIVVHASIKVHGSVITSTSPPELMSWTMATRTASSGVAPASKAPEANSAPLPKAWYAP